MSDFQEVSRILVGSNCGRPLEKIVLPDSAKALSSKHDFDLQVDTHLSYILYDRIIWSENIVY